MALFPVNQNVQWFTPTAAEVTALKTAASGLTNTIKKADGKVWFAARSGNNTHGSEIINIKNGGYVKYIAEADMEYKPKYLTVTYDSNVSATPISGEVYGIYLNQKKYHTIGERSYMELGAEVRYGSKFHYEAEGDFNTANNYVAGDVVRYATDGKTYMFKSSHSAGAWSSGDVDEVPADGLIINSVARLMAALAQAFIRNLGSDSDLYTISHTATTFVLTEKTQDWIQGLMQQEHVMLEASDMFLSNVTVNTIERDDWATITLAEDSVNTIKNSKDIADMEWFYLGEHGDQQRLMGYPYVSPSQLKAGYYNIKPEDGSGYDLIVIHHAYIGNGTFVQKSEQDIMIAVPAGDGQTIASNLAIALEAIASGTVTSKIVYPF